MKFSLQCLSRTNAITGGRTHLQLFKIEGTRVQGMLGFMSYPSRYGFDWTIPPAHLVHLWWVELDELACMVESGRAEASDAFRDSVAKRRWLKRRSV